MFLLGGLKVSDGFSMMGRVLGDGTADRVLTAGVLGEIFLMADGVALGGPTERFVHDHNLAGYIGEARALLADHRERIALPVDVAVLDGGRRRELAVDDLPVDELCVDIGEATMTMYEDAIATAGTVFANGPAGAYEQPGADLGTRRLWTAVASAPGVSTQSAAVTPWPAPAASSTSTTSRSSAPAAAP